MAKWINIAALTLLIAGLVAVLTINSNSAEPSMTREQKAWAMIEAGALLVDVRTQAEFDAGHFDKVLFLPHTEVIDRMSEFGSDKSRPIVLYCRSGGRAGKAEKILAANGFTSVHNAGGYEAMLKARP